MGDPATEENKQNAKNIGEYSPKISPALRRFIHLGCSFGPYHAQRYHIRGIAPLHPYSHDQVLALDAFSELLVKDGNRLVIGERGSSKSPSPDTIDVIDKVLKENEGTSRRAALFILAACCRSERNDPFITWIKEKAYAYIKKISSPDDLLIFIKFYMDLSPKKKGWGAGFRRALKSWYLERGDMELAEQLICVRQRFCWSHKDVLKLLHAKPKNKVQDIIFGYTMFDIEKARELFKAIEVNDPSWKDADNLMKFLEAADELRKLRIPKGCTSTTEVEKAVNLIKTYKFELENCDDTMHVEPLVWEALLEHMPFWKVLEHLPKLRCNRVLKPGEDLNKAILNSLKRLHDALSTEPPSLIISPAVVFVSMQTYRRVTSVDAPTKMWMSARITREGVVVRNTKHTKNNQKRTAKQQGSADAVTAGMSNLNIDRTKKIRELPKLNPKIVEMLGKIFVTSIKAMKPTGKGFIFATGKTHQRNGCLVNTHVMTHEASALLFICLDTVEAPESVSGYCIDSNSTNVVKLKSPGCSIAGCSREIVQDTTPTPINVDCWINYLSQQKLATDVLVVVAESFVSENSGMRILESLKKYRKDTDNPNVKLVIVSLDSKVLPHIPAEKYDYGILMVYGFDSHLPFIIQRFALGDF